MSWEPTEEQFLAVKELATLGWSSAKIAEALDITPDRFAGAVVRYPRLKIAYEQGVEDCKALPERQLSWRPTPKDITKVEALAATGLRENEIAAKLGISRTSFLRRMNDTPQLRIAFEQGNGEYRAGLIEQSNRMLEQRDPDLKWVGSLMIFKMKAYCGLSEKDKPVIVEGKIEHTHRLNAPPPVAIKDITEYAKFEMQRASEIAERMKTVAGSGVAGSEALASET